MEMLFWLSIGLIAYVYVGYPVLLAAAAALIGDREPEEKNEAGDARSLPPVTVIVAARNEARRLPGRIANLLASDYPADRMQVVVASDGSTDGTVEALAPFASRIELIMLPPEGKARALNAAVARARHPILVFADARQRFAPDTIRRLVRHFSRLSVGAVSGELVIDCEDSGAARPGLEADATPAPSSSVADGVGAYWKYEKWLRRKEAAIGSTLGVTGAVYAMRRSLWQPLPPDTILDDVLGPMRIVLRRYRVIFDRTACAFDEVSPDAAAETRRKIRTLAGNYQLMRLEPRLLVPFANPVWLQFVSHKVGRLIVPYALVTLFAASAWLAVHSWLYATAFAGQLGFYGLAAYGARLDRQQREGRRADGARGETAYPEIVNRHEAA